jgi:hypothetical protein
MPCSSASTARPPKRPAASVAVRRNASMPPIPFGAGSIRGRAPAPIAAKKATIVGSGSLAAMSTAVGAPSAAGGIRPPSQALIPSSRS